MQQTIGHRPELHLNFIYIGYWSAVNYLQWDVEITLELDYEGVNTPMGLSDLLSKLIYNDDMVYEGYIKVFW